MKGYKKLASAIIICAIYDYVECYGAYLVDRNNQRNNEDKLEIEDFFRSDYFCGLTDLDGELLLYKLQDRVKKGEI